MDRLTQTVDRLREEIDMFETQCAAQMEETKAAQKALSEAITEIEVSKNLNLFEDTLFSEQNIIYMENFPIGGIFHIRVWTLSSIFSIDYIIALNTCTLF